MTPFIFPILLAVSMILSVASPAIVLLRRSHYSQWAVFYAQRWIFVSAFVVIVATANYCGVYFERGNYIVGGLAVAAGVALAGFSFVYRPLALRIVVCPLGLLGWMLAACGFALGAAWFDDSPRTFRMVDGTYCRGTMTESGLQVDIFHKYWIIENVNLRHDYADRFSKDVDPADYPGKRLLTQCAELYDGPP